ncbi:MAG: glycosyltransferase family 4 protein [Chthoniobacterales bacterium]|nr:glycosyltransferase family 4 protein [Chthoniobacterales bacterium]
MRVVVATTQVPFIRGGAEVHGENLCAALRAAGHLAEIVAIPFKWYPPERILDTMLACRLLDLEESNGKRIDLVIGLKFPAYLIPHSNKVLWILHQHRTAYEQWNHVLGDMINFPNGREVRDAIRAADRNLIPEAKRVYSNSRNVSARLRRFCGIDSTPLYHPPLNVDAFRCETAEDYVLVPSRINRAKRQLLAVQALAQTNSGVKLVFCGESEEIVYDAEIEREIDALGLRDRVRFCGRVDEEEKLSLYACALAVLYVPFDEDYGYVTLEAMLARKPVITCTDSGGPLEFVVNGVTGFIAAPDADSVGTAIDRLGGNKLAAAAMGVAGWDRYHAMKISWDTVVTALTS